MYFGYLEVALGGYLGDTEINRARLLAESDLGPLAARKEFVFSTRAFIDSPIVGYGFEPEVKREIIEDGYQELISNGIKIDYTYLDELPMHSFIMSAFVQGGIFAGIFWLFAIFNSLKAFFYTIEMQRFERPLAAYLSLALIDRILFSPFGAYERLTAAIFLSYILTVRKINKSNLK
jgi:O-antigen ligase